MLLSKLRVLAVDCQATRGHLLEVGWASEEWVESRLVRLPEGVSLPSRVQRATGLSEDDLASGSNESEVWQLLDHAARGADLTAIHFARFEAPYLKWLHHKHGGSTRYPFRVLCTHHLVSRLVPELPRRSLRAAAGYFGHALGEKRRAGDHAAATLALWRACVSLLSTEHGVRTVEELERFLNDPAPARPEGRRYPMPPSAIAELPSSPGVYRMLRDNGDVLYVGKAASLRQRVRSYFAPGARHAEHTLEMLSQARDLGMTETATAFEAALLEVAEIHRLDPPYNRALRSRERAIVFATPDLLSFQSEPDASHRVGPLPASFLWTEWPEAASGVEAPLAYGAKLWPGEAEEPPAELTLGTDEAERRDDVLRRASHLVRRAHWFRLIRGAKLAWPDGEIELRKPETPWTIEAYDRHVVFTSELRRILTASPPPNVELQTEKTTLTEQTLFRLLKYV